MTTKKPYTKQEILDTMESPDELDDAFADLVVLSQQDAPTDDETGLDNIQSLEAFDDAAFEAIAEILSEADGNEISVLDLAFADQSFTGTYQQGGKKYSFEVTENDGEWTKRIEEL